LEQELAERRLELADEATVSAFVKDLRNLLAEGSLTERKSFVRSFIKEIKVTGNQVQIFYTIPLSPKRVTEEQILVLSIVHDGGR
jgi:site-specific DNA recombinase